MSSSRRFQSVWENHVRVEARLSWPIGQLVRPAMVAALGLSWSVCSQAAFPDAHDPPPAGWQGPVFKLSQSYPTSLPSPGTRPWLSFDFKNPSQVPQYIEAVLSYCLQGNTANNFADVSQNTVRKWYHTPWLHAGTGGREFIHGMTRERPSQPRELGPNQTQERANWAVGFYNPRGGYTTGRVWANETRPDPRRARFPLHTVSCKLLFTTATVTEVPFLDGSLEWEADINRANGTGPRPKLRLLQVDVAVRDKRADSTTGWVFGTFQYEKAASASANWWEHLVPVGLMWGSDPEAVKASQSPREQWINENRGQKLHLGLRGLLNGPIDNPRASCSACHGLAQVNKVDNPSPAIPRAPTNDNPSAATIDRYFKNIRARQALSTSYISTDYSLQLQIGIRNAINGGGATLPTGLAGGTFLGFGTPNPTAGSIVIMDRAEN
jgi:hypothetical protein